MADHGSQLGSAVLIASVGTSWLYLRSVYMPPSMWRMVTKTASTSLLSVFAALQGAPPLLSTALALGSVGDACLSWDGDAAFLSGLGSFLAAHVVYIVLFARTGGGTASILGSRPRMAAAGLLVCAFAPVMVSQLMPRAPREMRLPILVYTAAIVTMVLAALTLENRLVIAGALSFTVSDAILSADKFLVSPASTHRRWMPYAVWVLYYAGQLQIALGFNG
jgi:uncharacterized membrane protein YhhN